MVYFRSRCKKARPQDTAKGVQILEGLCFPEKKRFVDSVQDRGMDVHIYVLNSNYKLFINFFVGQRGFIYTLVSTF